MSRLEKIARFGNLRILRCASWIDVPGLVQGVTVRRAGGDGPSFDELAGAAADAGFHRTVRLRQVHGVDALDESELAAGGRAEGDAVTGSLPGVLGVVSVADCVPGFLLHREKRVWAAVHAGWRGVAAGVLGSAVDKLAGRYDIVPAELVLYLGPSICGKCYEVGPDVAARLRAVGDCAGVEPAGEGKSVADLRAILLEQARRAGLRTESAAAGEYCTRCHNHLFHSFRVEGREGLRKMWGVIGFVN